ncbi:Aerobic-type carbon monoxide dehydrogenase large subunit CoxL/CutL-like [Gaiella occulta]|uniref:Aerobic-type carbon monoxide dehydrogenase large subunit CoxL/CutL-like n=1 Tax=Gaiella occulta TaxID=1002870 RepID=A0A7M2Z0D1_9ACTN|nr:xanthine dehydrogenase family protein molybdopterin-binding subunit [Gaiella occulta]RDI75741.1 Aerobic-type carbon monoxide dehydrogenase large subunit CoxL/CutL-like [Gaiella occulta]
MARLVKTQTEMEGRYQDVWVLIDEEDDVETWDVDADLALVGRPAARQDGAARAAGRVRYTVDVRLAGMLHAAVLRSPVAHGIVRGLDLDAARSLPGVRAVLGPESELSFTARTPAFAAEPRYAGQPIAAVAADTPDQARAALAALALEIEPLAHVVDPQHALVEQRFVSDPVEEARGDVDAALAAAEVRVELEIETPAHLQTPLEPHAAVASWDGDELTAWVSTQGMFSARDELAKSFGVRKDQVRVLTAFVGGGFGGKQGAGFEALVAAELARVSGRPVRLVNDRHAEQLDGGRRAATRQTIRLGARRDGTITAIDADAVIAMGQGGWVFPVTIPARTLYRCDDVRTMTFPVKTNLRPQNAFRAPGVMEGVTAFEQAVDELASALGIDPLELRRRNHADVDQASGLPYSSKQLLWCYDRAAELAGWERREDLRGPQPDGLLRGMGCATQIWWGGGGPPSHATVRLDGDGHAQVVTGIQDIGTGTLTSARIVAAEELGLPLDRVRVSGGDTRPNVYGPVAGGSQTTPSVLPAVRSAAAKVRKTLLQLAGDVLEIAPDDLHVRDGRIRSRDGALDVDVIEVTGKLGDATIDGSGSRGPNPDGFRVHTFGCQIAQVAVDAAVGEVRVERVVAVHDVGRIVNPLGASSQVEGGVLQGMAFALTEELVLDPTTGAPVNAHLDDYKLPTIADVPEITIDFAPVPDANLPNVGAKGLGEPPIVPTAAAIANAFAHATGRRCAALPLTRARVLEALS